ncbi:glycosyltransferase [Bacillus taeanensis]|uniref:Glycosyltransferase family 1 protein n=1 Tax=Bacillus taeanensis TaxID=273032 RepID=A0A366XWF4_9BACI|nr:glycosyltransferase [Bacillus taeanensis]RBW69956.1 glycosyltransferase family 1 protein [Bacillus taeanensis]
MKKIKLLVTTGDFSRYISPDFHYLLTEVSKLTDLIVWHKSGDIHEILNTLNVRPDFIFINEFGESNSPTITGLESLDIPYAVYLYDIHHRLEERKSALDRMNVKYIFSHYRDKFYEWYSEFSDKMYWLPQHANTKIFKDYALPKEIDYLIMGAVHHRVYPLRYKIIETMQNKPGFVYHQHPGYRNIEEHEKGKVFAGEKYAKEINKAKIFFTCDSQYKYPIAKYFEVPACNTLLLASSSKELIDLGFVPDVHFVSINEENFEEKAAYYLRNEEKRKKIAKNGFQLVHRKHSTSQRALELVTMIEKILKNERKKK